MKRRPYENRPTYVAAASVLNRVVGVMPRLVGGNNEYHLPSAPVHLFVSPEGGISVFTETHYRIARILKARGHAVAGVWCHGLFPRCPVAQMRRLEFEGDSLLRRAVCLHCCATNDTMARDFGIPLVDLRRWPTADYLATAERAVDAFQGRLIDFIFDGIAFGKLAAMDLVLATKRCNLEAPSPDIEGKWRVFIRTSLFSFLLFSDVLDTIAVTRIVLFNDYSMMLAARLAAEQRGIPALTITQAMHLNNDNRCIAVRRDISNNDYQAYLASWPAARDLPLTPDQVNDVCNDVICRLQATGSHIFSAAKTVVHDCLKTRLGFDPSRRLIVAYTSSLDELVAQRMTIAGANRPPVSEREAFSSQVEWLRFLTAFIADFPDLQLAIRVHPREGAAGGAARAGKIQRVESEHLGVLRSAFPHDPPHTRIFWPDDDVSSYDLAEIADVATVSFSTIGVELARLGVPVAVTVDGVGPFVDDCFTPLARSPDAFQDHLTRLLRTPPSAEVWRLAMRFSWHAFLGQALDLRSVVDLDGRLMEDDVLQTAPACDEVETVFTQATANNRTTPFARSRQPPSAHARDEETAALAAAAERILAFLGHPIHATQEDGSSVPALTPMVARLRHFHQELCNDLPDSTIERG